MKSLLLTLLFILSFTAMAQLQDPGTIKAIFDRSLKDGHSYQMLRELTQNGHRLSGSPGAATAVEWGNTTMKKWEFDSVWLQPIMVPHWVRGQKETARMGSGGKFTEVTICALGGSVGTGPTGLSAEVVEVHSFQELAALGKKNIQGKIVFFNRPMDPTIVTTFEAYGGAVDQRVFGASKAAAYGARAVVVRSMSQEIQDFPHTGSLVYAKDTIQIPAVAISTLHADLLSSMLKKNKTLTFYVETHCEMLEDVPSFNVVGELRGTEFPNEIIDVGGHLDSWDLAQGAHDDGTGCVQSIEVLRLFQSIGYRPKRTIRAVLFMNEENGLRGGTKYAELAAANKENHIVAIESDAGGFTPRGFRMDGSEKMKSKIRSWKPLLEPYGLTDFTKDGGGADIGPLGASGTFLMEFLPDTQRYFSYHHTKEDTFDKVSQRELELGAASIAALVYLIDQSGVK